MKLCFWHNIYCLRFLRKTVSLRICFLSKRNLRYEKVQRSDFNWSLLWFNLICSLLFSIVHSLLYFLPLPFFPSGQSVVRRQHEAKLTLGCRVCYHDDAEEIPDLVHPTWHDLQLFISAVSLLVGTLSEPSAHFPHLSVVATRVFCITVFYWNERRVLTVFQNVKAWLWGWFSCVLWQDHLSAPLRRSAH